MFVESFSVSILPDALTPHVLLHSRSREAVKVHLMYAYKPRGCVCVHTCAGVCFSCVSVGAGLRVSRGICVSGRAG